MAKPDLGLLTFPFLDIGAPSARVGRTAPNRTFWARRKVYPPGSRVARNRRSALPDSLRQTALTIKAVVNGMQVSA
jgi:hypothetical protein